MATVKILPLSSAAIFCCLLVCITAKELVVTHAPKYVSFHEQKNDALPASELTKVISHSLGVPTEEVAWKGMQQGSLFKRPKANVLISVAGYEGIEKSPLPLKGVAKFPVKDDVPSVDIGGLMNSIQSAFFDKSPLLLDAGVDNNFFDLHTDFDVFHKIPDTMRKMADRLLDSDSILQKHSIGALNSSTPSHLKLMGELQMIQDVFNTLSDKPEMLPKKSPDLLSFNINGLKDVASKHGPGSTQTKDAKNLITDFIDQITNDFRKLYKDNVMVEVLTIVPQGYVRKTRSLKAETASTKDLNLSKDYDENYPIIFNIILWFMIIMAIVLFAVSYGMWNMDPGRDSIIYRMTTTRLKKE